MLAVPKEADATAEPGESQSVNAVEPRDPTFRQLVRERYQVGSAVGRSLLIQAFCIYADVCVCIYIYINVYVYMRPL